MLADKIVGLVVCVEFEASAVEEEAVLKKLVVEIWLVNVVEAAASVKGAASVEAAASIEAVAPVETAALAEAAALAKAAAPAEVAAPVDAANATKGLLSPSARYAGPRVQSPSEQALFLQHPKKEPGNSLESHV